MLILASLLLSTASLASAPSCPAAFSVVNTTIGVISDSSQLNLCVSNAKSCWAARSGGKADARLKAAIAAALEASK